MSAKSDVPHFAATFRSFHGFENTIALALLDVSRRLDAVGFWIGKKYDAPSFYAFAFLVSYQIGTLFTDLRAIAHL